MLPGAASSSNCELKQAVLVSGKDAGVHSAQLRCEWCHEATPNRPTTQSPRRPQNSKTPRGVWCARCLREYDAWPYDPDGVQPPDEVLNFYKRLCGTQPVTGDLRKPDAASAGLFIACTDKETGTAMLLFGQNWSDRWCHFHGWTDPEDRDALMAAIRETAEETCYALGSPRDLKRKYVDGKMILISSKTEENDPTTPPAVQVQLGVHRVERQNLPHEKDILSTVNVSEQGPEEYYEWYRNGAGSWTRQRKNDSRNARTGAACSATTATQQSQQMKQSRQHLPHVEEEDDKSAPFDLFRRNWSGNQVWLLHIGTLSLQEREAIVDLHERNATYGIQSLGGRKANECEDEMKRLQWCNARKFLRELDSQAVLAQSQNKKRPALVNVGGLQGQFRECTVQSYLWVVAKNEKFRRLCDESSG